MAQVPTFKPTYFLAPTRNNPPEGLIQLGNIIQSPELPDDPLDLAAPVPITDPITPHNEYGWRFNFGSNSGTSTSVWASFLELLADAGGEAGVTWSKENGMEWTCDQITTLEFRPSAEWLEKVVADPKIRQKLIKWKFWQFSKEIYVVVGVKIAIGASLVQRFAKDFNLNLHVGVDLTAAGLPVDVGAGLERNKGSHREESVEKIDDFVIGYRLRKIKLGRKMEIKQNTYHEDGAAFRAGEGKKEDEEVDILVEGLDENDVQAWEFRMQADEVNDQDDATYVAVKTGKKVAI